MAFLTKKLKKFHDSKVDNFEKLPTRASLFYDLLHFKGCPYLNHKYLDRKNFYNKTDFKVKVSNDLLCPRRLTYRDFLFSNE